MFKFNFSKYFQVALLTILCCAATKIAQAQTGKRPIIIIPGITGSELINSETGEKVWFTFSQALKNADGKIIKASYSAAEPLFFCESHESLLSNQEIEDNFLVTLLKEILK